MKNTINRTAINLFKRIRFITNHTIPYLRTTSELSNEERTRRINSIQGLLKHLKEEYTFELNFQPVKVKSTIRL